MSALEALPSELLLHIGSFMDITQLFRMCMASRTWYMLLKESDQFMMNKCESNFKCRADDWVLTHSGYEHLRLIANADRYIQGNTLTGYQEFYRLNQRLFGEQMALAIMQHFYNTYASRGSLHKKDGEISIERKMRYISIINFAIESGQATLWWALDHVIDDPTILDVAMDRCLDAVCVQMLLAKGASASFQEIKHWSNSRIIAPDELIKMIYAAVQCELGRGKQICEVFPYDLFPLEHQPVEVFKAIVQLSADYCHNYDIFEADCFLKLAKWQQLEQFKLLAHHFKVYPPYLFDVDHALAEGLHYCARHKNITMISAIVDSCCCGVDVRNAHGQTALMIGASVSDIPTLHSLVVRGADLEARDTHERTAIQYSVDIRILEWLVDQGADITAEDCNGRSVLDNHRISRWYQKKCNKL